MAIVSLKEARAYLKVETADDDAVIKSLLSSAESLVRDVARLSEDDWEGVSADESDLPQRAAVKVAVFYALAYLYEHREEADHHGLMLTLRSLLFSIRESVI